MLDKSNLSKVSQIHHFDCMIWVLNILSDVIEICLCVRMGIF